MNLSDVLNALGWQGGTHTQAAAEIERLKLVEQKCVELLSDLAFQQGNGKLRMHKLTEAKCTDLAKLLGKYPS